MGRNKSIEDAEVLAAAREVFRREGHAAPTRDIARAAGISQAVLYQRFGSKEELFFRAMTPEPADVEALFGKYPPEGGAFKDLLGIATRLHAYLRAFQPTLLHVLAFPNLDAERLKAWHSELPFLHIIHALAHRFQRMNSDGLTSGADPHASAVAFMAAVHSLAFFEVMTTPEQRKGHKANVRALVEILWQGLEPRYGKHVSRDQ
jgi:AcrR family transcriptional regulator